MPVPSHQQGADSATPLEGEPHLEFYLNEHTEITQKTKADDPMSSASGAPGWSVFKLLIVRQPHCGPLSLVTLPSSGNLAPGSAS
jgi:hypothetical protein